MKEVFLQYRKALVAAGGVVLSLLVTALAGDGVINLNEWSNVVVLGTGALGVALAPNVPGYKYTKAILAAGAAVASLLVSLYTGGLTTPEVWQLVVAALTAAGVYQTPNRGDFLDRTKNAKLQEVYG